MTPTSFDDARGQLTRQVLGARTLSDIAAAQQALREWLTAHPEEDGLRWGFEQLAQMQEIAEMEEARCATPPPTTPVT